MAPTRMTPHRWRRTLQILDIGLAAALIASAALLLGADREAEALDAGVRRGYEQARLSGLRWKPAMPVDESAMGTVVWRYAGHDPVHWPFSGPLPPAPREQVGPLPAVTDAPERLARLGHVSMVACDPDTGTAIGFHFDADGKERAFEVGEIIRASEGDAARFRLRSVLPAGDGVYHIGYEVLAGDAVEATSTYVHDSRGPDTDGGPIRPARGSDPTATGAPAVPGRLLEPVEPARLDALRPTVHVRSGNARDRVLELDAPTVDYFRGRGFAGFTDLVKTAVAKDPGTGRVLGLRLTGMDARVRADTFGIRRGDILVSINDRPVSSRDEAIRIAQGLDPRSDALVKVVVDRAGTLLTFRVDARDPRVKRKIPYFTWR